MWCDVTRCGICIPNNVEYLNKGESNNKFYQRIRHIVISISDFVSDFVTISDLQCNQENTGQNFVS